MTFHMQEDQIIKFFGIIDKEAQKLEYGQMTVTVYIGKGLPVAETMTLVKWKKRKYKTRI